jgi:hypothetical protein
MELQMIVEKLRDGLGGCRTGRLDLEGERDAAQGNSKASTGHQGCDRTNVAIGDFWSALRHILAGVVPTLAVLALVFE